MIVQAYGLLVDLDKSSEFCAAMKEAGQATCAFIVTNDDRRYQSVSRQLPDGVEAARLYESYLTNFRFVSGSSE